MVDKILLYSHRFGQLTVFNASLLFIGYLVCFYSFFGKQTIPPLGDDRVFLIPIRLGLTQALVSTDRFTDAINYLNLRYNGVGIALFANCLELYCVLSIYSFGRLFHENRGWKFLKPFNGGPGFALSISVALISQVLAIVTPWLALSDSDILVVLGFTPQEKVGQSEVTRNFGILLMISALYALSSLFYVFIAILMFDSQAESRHEKLVKIYSKVSKKLISQEEKRKKLKSYFIDESDDINDSLVQTWKLMYSRTKNVIASLKNISLATLTEIEEQKYRLSLVNAGNKRNNYYVFLLFTIGQLLLSIYLNVVLHLVDTSIQDETTRLLSVSSVLLLCIGCIISTQWICGRLRNGRLFRHFQIWKGGWKFITLQITGWIFVSISFLEFWYKLFHVRQIDLPLQLKDVPGLFYLTGQIFIILSVFQFDKSKVLYSILSQQNESKERSYQRGSTQLENEIREARVMKIFGLEYNYADEDRFAQDYILQRKKILENIDKSNNITTRGRSIVKKRNKRNKTRSPGHQSNIDSDAFTDSDSEHVWEEYEDESGNIFYYNVTTGVSYRDLPEKS